MASDDNNHNLALDLPTPEACGYACTRMEGVLRIRIRGRFDHENKGQPWAGEIINAIDGKLERVEVDFTHCQIVSSTVFAGLIQLHQGFRDKATEGVHLVNVGNQVRRSLQMLRIDSMFTIC
ncbi:MAG: STAS domain-containing protein [Planctomycetota bacterium]